jgi:murein DD-endopeptidase MepM/ murein hydrolase activator NlpD
MDIDKIRRCGVIRAGLVTILASLVAACAGQTDPAPVFLRGSAEPSAAPMPPPQPARQIVVQRGQTLGGVAQAYHVPKSAIIAANRLQPPYELKAGARLIIPGAGGSTQMAMGHSAAAPGVGSATPLPPPHPESLGPAPPSQSLTPASGAPPSAAHGSPDVIPLDGPPPPKQNAAAPPSAPPPAPRTAGAALTPPSAEPSPPAGAIADGGQGSGGRFPWPVRGHVLANYGNSPGGGHNDGINIAAPRGTPVRTIDAGTVAYVGNEVKGYGNLVLIRHANGWISAYAHLDDLTVKVGDPIAAGQVIAKVGDSGGVGEPQLHFELRRGKKPVDPREFLTPAPSAENPARNKTG